MTLPFFFRVGEKCQDQGEADGSLISEELDFHKSKHTASWVAEITTSENHAEVGHTAPDSLSALL